MLPEAFEQLNGFIDRGVGGDCCGFERWGELLLADGPEIEFLMRSSSIDLSLGS